MYFDWLPASVTLITTLSSSFLSVSTFAISSSSFPYSRFMSVISTSSTWLGNSSSNTGFLYMFEWLFALFREMFISTSSFLTNVDRSFLFSVSVAFVFVSTKFVATVWVPSSVTIPSSSSATATKSSWIALNIARSIFSNVTSAIAFVATTFSMPSPVGLFILINIFPILFSPKLIVIYPSPSSGVAFVIWISDVPFSSNISKLPASPIIESRFSLFNLIFS